MSRLRRTESRESVLSSASNASRIGNYEIGDRVEIDGRPGTIAFIGTTQFAQGEWIGLILDEPTGKNDGSLQGIRYFECEPNFGLFCKAGKLKRVAPTPSEPISPHAAEFGFDVGDKVSVAGGKLGTIRFLDVTKFASGVWAGIELDQPNGKNDGCVQGVRYFECKPLYGLFVPAAKTELVQSKRLTTRHNKASLLRYQQKKLGGSRESLSSIGASSLASSRIGTIRRPQFTTKPTPPPGDGTVQALQEALKEKERHLEQMMQEREMEKMEMARILRQESTDSQSASHKNDLKAATSTLKNTVVEKEKKIEELLFSIDELKIDKETLNEELEETKKQLEVFTQNILLTADASNEGQEELKRLNMQLGEERDSARRLRIELEQTQQKLTSLQEDTAQKINQHQKLSLESTQSHEELTKVKEELSRAAEFENEAKALRDQYIQVSNELAETKLQLTDLEKQRDEQMKHLDELNAANTSLQTELSKVKETLVVADQFDKETLSLREQLENEKTTTEKIQGELMAMQNKLDTLNQELLTKNTEHQKLTLEAATLRQELEESKTKFEAEKLEGENKNLSLVDEITRLRAEMEMYLNERNLAEQSNAKHIDALKAELKQMSQQLESGSDAQQALAKMSEEKLQIEADREKIANELRLNESQLATLKNEHHAHTEKLEKSLEEKRLKLEAVDKDLSAKDAQIQQLSTVNTSLQTELSKVKEALVVADQFEKETLTLREQLENEKTTNEKIQGELMEMQNKLDTLNQELLTKNMEQQKLTLEAATLRQELEESKTKFEAEKLEGENKNLSLVDEITRLRAEMEMNLNERNLAEQSNAKHIDALKAELKQMSQQLESGSDAQKALAKMSEEKLQIEADREKIANELRINESQLATLKNEHHAHTEKLEKSLEEKRLKLEAVEKDLSNMDTQNQQLNAANTSLQTELSKVQEELVVAGQFEKEAMSLREKLENGKMATEKSQSELEGAKRKLDILEKDFLAKNTECEKLHLEAATFQQELERSKATFEAQKQEIELQNSSLVNEISLLRAEIETSQSERNAAEQTSAKEIEAMKNKLQEMTQQLELGSDAERTLAKLNEEKQQIEADREKISHELQLNVSQLAALKGEHQTMKQKHEEVNSELAQAQQSLATISGQLEEKEKELQKRSASEQETKKNLEEARANAEKIKASSESEIKRLETEANALRSQIESNGQSNEQVTVELSTQVSEISMKNAELQGEMENIQTELARLKKVETEVKRREADADSKVKLWLEMEEAWKQKEERFVMRIEELEAKIELEKKRTASDEVTTLRQQVDFLNSIIADKQKKNDALEKENKKLKEEGLLGDLSDEVDCSRVTRRKKQAPRKYCDICEIFDAHETEDCSTQSSMVDEFLEHSHNSIGSSWPGATEPDRKTPVKKVIPPERPYCEQCEVFGHTKGSGCPGSKTPKVDYTF